MTAAPVLRLLPHRRLGRCLSGLDTAGNGGCAQYRGTPHTYAGMDDAQEQCRWQRRLVLGMLSRQSLPAKSIRLRCQQRKHGAVRHHRQTRMMKMGLVLGSGQGGVRHHRQHRHGQRSCQCGGFLHIHHTWSLGTLACCVQLHHNVHSCTSVVLVVAVVGLALAVAMAADTSMGQKSMSGKVVMKVRREDLPATVEAVLEIEGLDEQVVEEVGVQGRPH